MASSSEGQTWDYTEGASAIDIADAVSNAKRSRRDSWYGQDGAGTVLDGPGQAVIPSSVSRMSFSEGGRRSGEWSESRSRRQSEDNMRGDGPRSREREGAGRRRMSMESTTSFGDEMDSEYASEQEQDDDGQQSSRTRRSGGRRRLRRSPSQASRSVTVFENIASIFGRSAPQQPDESPPHSWRPSLSIRSSRTGPMRRGSSRRSDAGSEHALTSDGEEVGGDDRWGYASEEEDYESDQELMADLRPDNESMDLRSLDERLMPDSLGPSLPLMAGDPIFGGEERIDMGELHLLDPPPPGPPSRQAIFIADEDAHIRFVGYEVVKMRQVAWRTLCVLTLGLLGFVGHWFPRLWLRWVAREKPFRDTKDGFVVVEFIDLFIIIPIAVTMVRTAPFHRIHPKGPTASLVSKKVLASIIGPGQVVVMSTFQFWAFFWVRRQPWYTPPPKDPNPDDSQVEAKNFENSVLFLTSSFQYILVAAVFSIGPPYRKPMWTNILLMLSIGLLVLFSCIVLITPPKPLVTILELMSIPFASRLLLLFVVLLNCGVSVVFEWWGAQTVAQLIGYVGQLRKHRRVRGGKVYKAIDSDAR